MKALRNTCMTILGILLLSCNNMQEDKTENDPVPAGKLFIIGGGKRPVELVDRLINEAGVRDSGYILVLPMASEMEDSAVYYSSKQFTDRDVKDVRHITSAELSANPQKAIKLITKASLIYISGGDQNRFMERIGLDSIREGIVYAYQHGTTIAGTSAGAAVMSVRMITGNEIKHPEYNGNFRTIEANNIELKEGLGLMQHAIIDQHFIKRQRMNRLISVALENPESLCIGIDESTALLVTGNQAEVVGVNQVITLQHPDAETKVVHGLLGGQNLRMNIFLPGDVFSL